MIDDKMYEQLVAINNAEQATYWTRYNIQVVINTGAIAAYGSIALRQPPPAHHQVLAAMCVPGLLLAVVWLCMTIAGDKWCDFWQHQLRRVEQKLPRGIPKPFTTAKRAWRRRRFVIGRAPVDFRSVRSVARLLPVVFIAGWIVVGILMLN